MFLLPYTELQDFNGCSSFSGQYHLTAMTLRTGYFPFWKNAWTNTTDSRENEISRNLWLVSLVLLGHSDDSLFLCLFSSQCNTWHCGRLSVNESIFSCTEVSGPNGNNSWPKVTSPRTRIAVILLQGIIFLCSYIRANSSTAFFLFTCQSTCYTDLTPLLAWWAWFGAKTLFPNPTANGTEGGRGAWWAVCGPEVPFSNLKRRQWAKAKQITYCQALKEFTFSWATSSAVHAVWPGEHKEEGQLHSITLCEHNKSLNSFFFLEKHIWEGLF